MERIIRTDYFTPENTANTERETTDETPQGHQVSPLSSAAIYAVMKYIRDNYDFGERIPSVEEFCEHIITKHIETHLDGHFGMGTPFDLPELMLSSGNYCIAAQRLGRVHDHEMNDYANTRGGIWIYMDSYKWEGRQPSFNEVYRSDYITFRQMLDTLQFINSIDAIVARRDV